MRKQLLKHLNTDEMAKMALELGIRELQFYKILQRLQGYVDVLCEAREFLEQHAPEELARLEQDKSLLELEVASPWKN